MKKHNFGMITMAAIALLAVVLIGACKHSGMALSDRGQLMKIDIELPQDLSDGQIERLLVTIANRGVNTIDDVIFEVEMPNELVIMNQNPSPGVKWTDRLSSYGTKIYQYRSGDIEVGTESEVKFEVRAQFGSLNRTGDIKVTAWSDDIPGDRLIETRYIKLRN